MAVVLQIGAGGVGGVVAHKMAKNREVFTRIILASRNIAKCKAIADSIRAKGLGEIEVDEVDADNVEALVALIEKYKPKLVVNVALPYQDLSIMEACLRTKTHYLDTANYEHPDSAHFEYKEQWAYDKRYKEAGIFALLGSGFDPGVTNVFCAYAQKHYFDEIYSIDILDCNAGDHGYAFATNFNPEINLREVSSKARYWVACDSSLTQSLNECCNSTSVTTDKVAPSSHFAQHSNLTQDTRIAGVSNGDSKSSLVSPTDLALNADLKQDTIYRKFEREEQHWRAEVERKEQERAMQKGKAVSSDSIASKTEVAQESQHGNSSNQSNLVENISEREILEEKSGLRSHECGDKTNVSMNSNPCCNKESQERNSKILSEKCGLQEKSQGSYLEGNDRSDFSPLPHLSPKDEFLYFGGQWRDIAPLALMKEWDYPEVGVKNSYLLYHEELESLIRNIKGLRQIRFFMTFGESYLAHMKVLENIGFLRIDEVTHKGQKIVPLEVLKTLLPDPASLASRTKGQTHIGCYMKGIKDGKERTIYIYNICDHEACYKEVNAQGVSYTTGVPAMIGAKLICEGKWGVGAIKNSSLGNGHSACGEFLESASSHSLQRTTSASHSLNSHNSKTSSTILECQDNISNDKSSQNTQSTTASIATAIDPHLQNTRILDSNVVDSSIESYNATRLEANKDMPSGGEYQGIDNGAELYKGVANESAEVFLSEQSAKISKETTQGNSKILSEKSGLRSHECGDKTNASIAQANDKLPDLSLKAEFQGSGVWNMEQNDPDPFMSELNKQGLPYVVLEIETNGKTKVLEDGRK